MSCGFWRASPDSGGFGGNAPRPLGVQGDYKPHGRVSRYRDTLPLPPPAIRASTSSTETLL